MRTITIHAVIPKGKLKFLNKALFLQRFCRKTGVKNRKVLANKDCDDYNKCIHSFVTFCIVVLTM